MCVRGCPVSPCCHWYPRHKCLVITGGLSIHYRENQPRVHTGLLLYSFPSCTPLPLQTKTLCSPSLLSRLHVGLRAGQKPAGRVRPLCVRTLRPPHSSYAGGQGGVQRCGPYVWKSVSSTQRSLFYDPRGPDSRYFSWPSWLH